MSYGQLNLQDYIGEYGPPKSYEEYKQRSDKNRSEHLELNIPQIVMPRCRLLNEVLKKDDLVVVFDNYDRKSHAIKIHLMRYSTLDSVQSAEPTREEKILTYSTDKVINLSTRQQVVPLLQARSTEELREYREALTTALDTILDEIFCWYTLCFKYKVSARVRPHEMYMISRSYEGYTMRQLVEKKMYTKNSNYPQLLAHVDFREIGEKVCLTEESLLMSIETIRLTLEQHTHLATILLCAEEFECVLAAQQYIYREEGDDTFSFVDDYVNKIDSIVEIYKKPKETLYCVQSTSSISW